MARRPPAWLIRNSPSPVPDATSERVIPDPIHLNDTVVNPQTDFNSLSKSGVTPTSSAWYSEDIGHNGLRITRGYSLSPETNITNPAPGAVGIGAPRDVNGNDQPVNIGDAYTHVLADGPVTGTFHQTWTGITQPIPVSNPGQSGPVTGAGQADLNAITAYAEFQQLIFSQYSTAQANTAMVGAI